MSAALFAVTLTAAAAASVHVARMVTFRTAQGHADVTVDTAWDADFWGWNKFTEALHRSHDHCCDADVLDRVNIVDSGVSQRNKLRHWFAAPKALVLRFSVMMKALAMPAVRALLVADLRKGTAKAKATAAGVEHSRADDNGNTSRNAADGKATFHALLSLFRYLYRVLFNDPPMTALQLYFFWWFYSSRCLTEAEIDLLLPRELSCLFGRVIGDIVVGRWAGRSPAASVTRFHCLHKCALQQRRSLLKLVYKYGGVIVITIGGFLLEVLHPSFNLYLLGLKDGVMTLVLRVGRRFQFQLNKAVILFTYAASQIANSATHVSVKQVEHSMNGMYQRESFTVNALSFNIKAALPSMVSQAKTTSEAIADLNRRQRLLTRHVAEGFDPMVNVSEIMIREASYHIPSAPPSRKRTKP